MTYRNVPRRLLALIAFLLVSASAHAQLFRAYLASDGSDTNPCTLPAPCRLLPAALTAVADGGEIWMLDSANYNTGTVTVTKSATILAIPGAVGSLVGTGGGPAILVSTAGLKVALRNLVIVPLIGGGAATGVTMTADSVLIVDGCKFSNFSSAFVLTLSAGTTTIADSTFRTLVHSAVRVQGGARATISRSHFSGITTGSAVLATSEASSAPTLVTVSDSVMSGSQGAIFASSTGTGIARIVLTRSTIDNTQIALQASVVGTAGGIATIAISGNTVSNSSQNAWLITAGGQILTTGTNHFSNNVAGIGSLTTESPM